MPITGLNILRVITNLLPTVFIRGESPGDHGLQPPWWYVRFLFALDRRGLNNRRLQGYVSIMHQKGRGPCVGLPFLICRDHRDRLETRRHSNNSFPAKKFQSCSDRLAEA